MILKISAIVLCLVFSKFIIDRVILWCKQFGECGEIGRHDGLKIHCLVISVRVQVPPFLISLANELYYSNLENIFSFKQFQLKINKVLINLKNRLLHN